MSKVERITKEVNYIMGYSKPIKDWNNPNYVEWVKCFNRRYDND